MVSVQQLLQSKSKHEIHSITPEKSTYEALQIMQEYDIGAICVMEEGKLLGILTERDYARKIVLCGKTSRHTAVRETMRDDYPVVRPNATIEDCMQLMTDQRSRYVAVMDRQQFKGLISVGDVVKQMIMLQQASIDMLETYITGAA